VTPGTRWRFAICAADHIPNNVKAPPSAMPPERNFCRPYLHAVMGLLFARLMWLSPIDETGSRLWVGPSIWRRRAAMEQRRRNSSGAEGDAGGGALEPARRTALLRRSGCRRPTQGLSGNSSHELKGVPAPVTLFRLVRLPISSPQGWPVMGILDSGAKCNRAKQTGFARLCQAL
jgi:hypothetical protein